MSFIDIINILFESIVTDELYKDIIILENITILESNIISNYKLNDTSNFTENIELLFKDAIVKCGKYENNLINVKKELIEKYENYSNTDYYIDIISTKTFDISS